MADQGERNVLISPANDVPDHATSDDTGSLATTHEAEEDFDIDDELPTVPLMSRSRTIEEVDFRATFGDEKKVVADANLAPRRHSVLFVLIFLFLFAAALVDQRVRIQPDEHKPCEYGSSQKRDMELGQDGLPRKDLLSNCQNLEIWPESLQPSFTSTMLSYPILNGEKKRRWASASAYTNGSNTVPTTSASNMAPMAEPASNTTCSTEGQFMCNGSDHFGICSHGIVIWQHVSNGTQCQENQIVGANIPDIPTTDQVSLTSYGNGLGSATAWGPPTTPAVSTTTMPSSHGTTFQTLVSPTGNASVYGLDTDYDLSRLKQPDGYKGDCHPQGDRRVGDPDMCFCYSDGTQSANDNINHAINHACQYFEKNSLGPAPVTGQDWKQVFVSNYMYKDGDKTGRILIKLQYWADVNGNDIHQGGPCIIFRRTWMQCVQAYQSLLQQCTQFAQKGGLKYPGGYGMDSCAMWTIDLEPEKNNKGIAESIDGNHDYFLFVDPARASKISSASVTWPEPTTPRWGTLKPSTSAAPAIVSACASAADPQACIIHSMR